MKKNYHANSSQDFQSHCEHVETMKEYYAKTYHKYNEWHCDTNNKSSHNYAVKELIKIIKKTKSTKVLDVCCGTGRALKSILDHEIDAYGIDISPELINVAYESGIPINRLSIGDATSLPYKDGEFDISCVMGALHHTAIPESIVSEMLRVTKKGIVVSDEGNHLCGGIKSILVRLNIFGMLYKLFFKKEPRKSRRKINSEGDGPTFTFSVEEILPQIKLRFPKIKTLVFYRLGNFQTCSFWYPRIFAAQIVLIAHK